LQNWQFELLLSWWFWKFLSLIGGILSPSFWKMNWLSHSDWGNDYALSRAFLNVTLAKLKTNSHESLTGPAGRLTNYLLTQIFSDQFINYEFISRFSDFESRFLKRFCLWKWSDKSACSKVHWRQIIPADFARSIILQNFKWKVLSFWWFWKFQFLTGRI
jgi:hypothetical protein